MEYPTITNVVEADRKVIFHEVGHNWLYGILATNERNYPWMDESINNYYETRSAYHKHLIIKRDLGIDMKSAGANASYEGGAFERLYLRYLLPASRNEDQSSFLNSVEYTDPNYGGIIYGKASQAFFYLQQYLGDEQFDAMMQAYYEKWKFKHPLPNDFINHAKQFTGKDLG
jgi:aminopeptidase N